VPLLALGIHAVHSAKKGHRVPGVIGWILATWGILCASLLPVSGAWLFIVVGVLFIVGDRVRVSRH
jgi:membrane-bound ClpP family serine protease